MFSLKDVLFWVVVAIAADLSCKALALVSLKMSMFLERRRKRASDTVAVKRGDTEDHGQKMSLR
jgi:hypothetical protein